MARRKKDDSQAPGTDQGDGPFIDHVDGPFTDEAEGAAPARDDEQKQWTKRPDPFGFETIRWADGYAVSLKESDANREIFIQFGKGTKSDQPQNFELIKKMLKEEYGMYWDAKVQGWAMEIKPGITPLIKEQNKKVRTAVTEAFYKAVAMEESSPRGLSLTDHARERGGMAV